MQLTGLQISLLRASNLLLVVGLGVQTLPELFGAAQAFPPMESVVTAFLSALWLFSVYGLWQPIKMLPLLVFEVTWKVTWIFAIVLPRWFDGRMTHEFAEIAFACAFALPILLVFPWRKWLAF